MAGIIAPASDLGVPLADRTRRFSGAFSKLPPKHYKRSSRWLGTGNTLTPPEYILHALLAVCGIVNRVRRVRYKIPFCPS